MQQAAIIIISDSESDEDCVEIVQNPSPERFDEEKRENDVKVVLTDELGGRNRVIPSNNQVEKCEKIIPPAKRGKTCLSDLLSLKKYKNDFLLKARTLMPSLRAQLKGRNLQRGMAIYEIKRNHVMFATNFLKSLLSNYVDESYRDFVFSLGRKFLVDEIMEKIFHGVCSFEKRDVEKEGIETLENQRGFVEFFNGSICVPADIVNRLFSFLNVNKDILYNVGMVCSVFYMSVLYNWVEVILTDTNAFNVPLLVWGGVRKICVQSLSTTRKTKTNPGRRHIDLDHILKSGLKRLKVVSFSKTSLLDRFINYARGVFVFPTVRKVCLAGCKWVKLKHIWPRGDSLVEIFPNVVYLHCRYDFFPHESDCVTLESSLFRKITKLKLEIHLDTEFECSFFSELKQLKSLKLEQSMRAATSSNDYRFLLRRMNHPYHYQRFLINLGELGMCNLKCLQFELLREDYFKDLDIRKVLEGQRLEKLILLIRNNRIFKFVQTFSEDSTIPQRLKENGTLKNLVFKIRHDYSDMWKSKWRKTNRLKDNESFPVFFIKNFLPNCQFVSMLDFSNTLLSVKVKVSGVINLLSLYNYSSDFTQRLKLWMCSGKEQSRNEYVIKLFVENDEKLGGGLSRKFIKNNGMEKEGLEHSYKVKTCVVLRKCSDK